MYFTALTSHYRELGMTPVSGWGRGEGGKQTWGLLTQMQAPRSGIVALVVNFLLLTDPHCTKPSFHCKKTFACTLGPVLQGKTHNAAVM